MSISSDGKKFNLGFWERLPKPFFALAPMADVTDLAFRQMFVRHGKPDVMFTEFVSTDGLCSEGRKNLLRELRYCENERPIVAQIWGARPENFYKSALLIQKLKFDGIDINMGCPRPNEIKNGACSALIKNPKLAQKIILETKRGAGQIPVSVKTRIGFDNICTEEWVGALLKMNLAAITIHGRTARQMSKPPVHWEEIAKAARLRDRAGSKTLIIGNGDISSVQDGLDKVRQLGTDGVMVGRATFGNPWFFNREKEKMQPSIKDKLDAMVEHARLFEELFGRPKNFSVMKKHLKAYASGFPGAAGLRLELMKIESLEETETIVKSFLKKETEI